MKKFISMILAVVIAATLCVLNIMPTYAADDTNGIVLDFESYDVDSPFTSGYAADEWGFYDSSEAKNASATVVASGSETYGNVLKITEGGAVTQTGYQALSNYNWWKFTFSIKFEDMNEARAFSVMYSNKAYEQFVFNTDGTVTHKGHIVEDFIYETGKWYNVCYKIGNYNSSYLKIDDGNGNSVADTGYNYSYFPGGTGSRLFFTTTSANGGGVYYLDNINITQDTYTIHTFENYDSYTVGKSVTDFQAAKYQFDISANNNTTMTIAERAAGDMALKVSVPAGAPLVSASMRSKTSTSMDYASSYGVGYSHALYELDMKFSDKNVGYGVLAYYTSSSEAYIIRFLNDGTVKVGNDIIKGFTYKSGTNAPWYNIKLYVEASTGKIKAIISDGESTTVATGVTTAPATGHALRDIRFYFGINDKPAVASEVWVDNIQFKEFFPTSDFFAPTSYFSFDDLTAENQLPTGYSASSYSNWSVYNNKAGTVEGTGEVIDGRKALKVTRLTSDSRQNTTLRFNSMSNEPISAIDKIQFDVKKPVSNLGVAGDMIFVGDACVATISDGQKIKINGTEYDFTFGDWHRIAIDFNLGETTYTYNIKVINLDKNTLVAETQNITTTLTALPTSFQYLSGMPNGEYFYIDNVYMSGSDNKTYNLEQTWLENDVLPHLGAALTFNQSINSASASNEITLNGVKYTGADANAFLDASEFGTVRFAGLEGETSYDVEYKLYDMFGNAAEGKTRFTTGESYAFGDITLSKEGTLTAGDVTATLTGKISADMGASLIFALYEKGGNEMLEAKAVNIGWSREEDTYTVTLTVPEAGEYEVRAFLWDDAIRPIKLPVTLAQ